MNSDREPLPVERLASPDERRLTVSSHHEWRESIASPVRQWDEIDELVEEIRQAELERRGARA
jgi:hypothetical protein